MNACRWWPPVMWKRKATGITRHSRVLSLVVNPHAASSTSTMENRIPRAAEAISARRMRTSAMCSHERTSTPFSSPRRIIGTRPSAFWPPVPASTSIAKSPCHSAWPRVASSALKSNAPESGSKQVHSSAVTSISGWPASLCAMADLEKSNASRWVWPATTGTTTVARIRRHQPPCPQDSTTISGSAHAPLICPFARRACTATGAGSGLMAAAMSPTSARITSTSCNGRSAWMKAGPSISSIPCHNGQLQVPFIKRRNCSPSSSAMPAASRSPSPMAMPIRPACTLKGRTGPRCL